MDKVLENYITSSGRLYGVTGYKIGDDFIIIKTMGGTIYKYSYKSAGSRTVEAMKKLATNQEGLTSFIGRNKPHYESKS